MQTRPRRGASRRRARRQPPGTARPRSYPQGLRDDRALGVAAHLDKLVAHRSEEIPIRPQHVDRMTQLAVCADCALLSEQGCPSQVGSSFVALALARPFFHQFRAGSPLVLLARRQILEAQHVGFLRLRAADLQVAHLMRQHERQRTFGQPADTAVGRRIYRQRIRVPELTCCFQPDHVDARQRGRKVGFLLGLGHHRRGGKPLRRGGVQKNRVGRLSSARAPPRRLSAVKLGTPSASSKPFSGRRRASIR